MAKMIRITTSAVADMLVITWAVKIVSSSVTSWSDEEWEVGAASPFARRLQDAPL